MLRWLAVVALLLLATFAPGCRLFNRKAKVVPAPPPAPPPVETSAPKPPATQQPTVPPPPQISPEQPNLAGQQAPEPPVVKLPPPPKRHGRRPQPPQPGQETPSPQTAENPPATPAAPAVPELEQILSPQQRQAYNEAIDANIGRAQRTLDAVQSRRLNPDQKTTQERIRAFVQQANDARKTDLFRAKNLAERAAVLADDLVRSLQ